ncbi:hypothetical protein [Amycolatopsis sp. NBC_01480]|uniref:hypothetical protein n=1 Tax=Amycolatopsis sp. NBC_01480 TaxID=2903562 RepID=UPI002E2B6688|nr:hypothetical protein [Amycolatopsis sp. NBC_01480]
MSGETSEIHGLPDTNIGDPAPSDRPRLVFRGVALGDPGAGVVERMPRWLR